MSDVKPHIDTDKADPSMEEILATIRRIIAEDEHKGAERVVAPMRGESMKDNPGGASEPVLVLTEAIEDDGSVRHIEPPAETAAPGPAPAGRIEPQPPRPDIPVERI